jgi:hypothetical protein
MAAFQIVTPTKLAQGAVGVAQTVIYTVPANMVAYLKDIDISNTALAPVSVTVWAGVGLSASTQLIPGSLIPAASIFQWTGTQILNAGDTIAAQASAAGCNIFVSGAQAV